MSDRKTRLARAKKGRSSPGRGQKSDATPKSIFLSQTPSSRDMELAYLACLNLRYFLSGHACLYEYLRRYN